MTAFNCLLSRIQLELWDAKAKGNYIGFDLVASPAVSFASPQLLGSEVRFAQKCRYPYIYHLKTYKRSDLKTKRNWSLRKLSYLYDGIVVGVDDVVF